jgi:hypothetical protein
VAGRDPVAQCQAHHLSAVDSPARTSINVLNGGLSIFEVRVLEQAYQLAVIACMDLAINQQRYAFLKAQRGHAGLRHLFFQAANQAVQLQRAQLRQGGVHHHAVIPYW